MIDIIFAIVSFLVVTAAFWLGVLKLFKKRKPFYMKLIVCAIGCFMLYQQLFLINLWCNVQGEFSIGMIGILGCNCFFLSANYGTLDRIVDDCTTKNRKIRMIASIAPIIMLILVAIVFFAWIKKDVICTVLWVVMLLPTIPASYYNLKHICLPADECGFLHATRFCNIFELILYVLTAAFVVCSVMYNKHYAGILSLLMSVVALFIVISAIKGAKKWVI